jgi:adenylate cyclase
MAIEIEHKFLLTSEKWRDHVSRSAAMRQGYLTSNSNSSVRIRISGDKAWLNIKSAIAGNRRHEYEYEIPVHDADEIIASLCRKPLIEKTRHYVHHENHTWEIDEFSGENKGLIVAEIELSKQNEEFTLPVWIGKEVTNDLRYYNNTLAQHPYSTWK